MSKVWSAAVRGWAGWAFAVAADWVSTPRASRTTTSTKLGTRIAVLSDSQCIGLPRVAGGPDLPAVGGEGEPDLVDALARGLAGHLVLGVAVERPPGQRELVGAVGP